MEGLEGLILPYYSIALLHCVATYPTYKALHMPVSEARAPRKFISAWMTDSNLSAPQEIQFNVDKQRELKALYVEKFNASDAVHFGLGTGRGCKAVC